MLSLLKYQVCSAPLDKLRRRIGVCGTGLWTYGTGTGFGSWTTSLHSFSLSLTPHQKETHYEGEQGQDQAAPVLFHPVQWSGAAVSSGLPRATPLPTVGCHLSSAAWWGKGIEGDLMVFLLVSWRTMGASEERSLLPSTADKLLQTFNNA